MGTSPVLQVAIGCIAGAIVALIALVGIRVRADLQKRVPVALAAPTNPQPSK
jgi:hypothetical protein